MKECPFCLRPVGNDVIECPNCHNNVDIFRTGYFARPKLSRPKTAVIWIVAIVVVLLLAIGLYRGCAVSRRADASSDAGQRLARVSARSDGPRLSPGRKRPPNPVRAAAPGAPPLSPGRSAAP